MTTKKQPPTPKLIPLDMKLCTNDNNVRSHPHINNQDTFLCLINGEYYTGKFSKVWYGWSFYGWHGTPLQFDPPGTNASTWQQIWKIQQERKPRKVRIPEPKCQNPNCKGRLKRLSTCYGDPEGIRADSQCRKCKQIYGCTKGSRFKISKEEFKQAQQEDW